VRSRIGPRVAPSLQRLHIGAIMDRINTIRNISGQPAVFLRFGKAGYVVIGHCGKEHEVERSVWFALPPWIPTLRKPNSHRADY
jgi:hypothetical protein